MAARDVSAKDASWFGPPDKPARVRVAKRPRRVEAPTSLRAIIASSAFLVLFSASLLVGGHAAIDPLLRSAMTARETRDLGDVVVPLAGGKFCRHMSFDNATAEVIQGNVSPCPESVTRSMFRQYRTFSWGAENEANERQSGRP
ncbi:MAG TPA: hypothetical protein VH206_24340 [Xanthobacteraceae bacterium]|jgi:hypothetical protein|nr:hypothetical protein [Xanthobacteraceae bacterium]